MQGEKPCQLRRVTKLVLRRPSSMAIPPVITSAFHVAKGFGKRNLWTAEQQSAEALESTRTGLPKHVKPGGAGTMTSAQALMPPAPSAEHSSPPSSCRSGQLPHPAQPSCPVRHRLPTQVQIRSANYQPTIIPEIVSDLFMGTQKAVLSG